jgi:hypothetical protein
MIHQPLEILPHGCGRKSNYLPADSRLIIHENKMRRTCSRIQLLQRKRTKTGWGFCAYGKLPSGPTGSVTKHRSIIDSPQLGIEQDTGRLRL